MTLWLRRRLGWTLYIRTRFYFICRGQVEGRAVELNGRVGGEGEGACAVRAIVRAICDGAACIHTIKSIPYYSITQTLQFNTINY